MDVNVCSRFVHDGFATIRSRGRPRAVYRSDSGELLKETAGPYALPQFSNFQLISEDARQVPRWVDVGRSQLPIENYGTLPGAKSRGPEEPRRVTLRTFCKREKHESNSKRSASQLDQRSEEYNDRNGEVGSERRSNYQADSSLYDHYGWKREYSGRREKDFCVDNRRICDATPTEEKDPAILKPFCVLRKTSQENGLTDIDNNQYNVFKNYRENTESNHSMQNSKGNYIFRNSSDRVEVEKNKRTEVRDLKNVKNDSLKDPVQMRLKSTLIFKNGHKFQDLEKAKQKILCKNQGQPIYATPNTFSRSRNQHQMQIVDRNHVSSSDLYRTTAKYIEDINKNLAEIDKSYEELKANPRTYGIINRIAKSELLPLRDQSCDVFSYAKKRDMVPMPPITSIDVHDIAVEERSDKQMSSKNKYLHRPNSRGKLPPKVLPRSSSMENTSRHSTGFSAASASKSTESLYAISESLTDISRARVSLKQSDPAWSEQKSLRREKSQNLPKSNRDTMPKKTNKINKHGNEVKSAESKNEMSSSDDDVSIPRRSLDIIPPVASVSRRNRSRVDRKAEKPLLKKERGSNVVSDKISDKLEQTRFMKGRLKNRQYDTLPSRRPKISLNSFHKSSEDVIDGENRIFRENSGLQQKSGIGTTDVNYGQGVNKNIVEAQRDSIYAMDATEIILKGQMERSSHSQDQLSRTKRNSLESEEGNNSKIQISSFATLPRRGNLLKGQSVPLRRFSGNGPILEPLYEHAVSDPVKPRENQNVIPWWELATRKFRHRSCPSLQVN